MPAKVDSPICPLADPFRIISAPLPSSAAPPFDRTCPLAPAERLESCGPSYRSRRFLAPSGGRSEPGSPPFFACLWSAGPCTRSTRRASVRLILETSWTEVVSLPRGSSGELGTGLPLGVHFSYALQFEGGW